jgi:hypothetical protein
MRKEYGTISPVERVDRLVYECFEYLTEGDQRKFLKKFAHTKSLEDDSLVNHTLNELVLGAYVARQGFSPQYEPNLGGQTPEWLMTQKQTGQLVLLELVNFHLPEKEDKEVRAAMKSGAPCAYWLGPNTDRVYSRLQEKMAKYKSIVEERGLHYVVTVFGRFSSALTIKEVRECVDGGDALFPQYPQVTGLVFMYTINCEYRFEYLPNSHATKKEIAIAPGSVQVRC